MCSHNEVSRNPLSSTPSSSVRVPVAGCLECTFLGYLGVNDTEGAQRRQQSRLPFPINRCNFGPYHITGEHRALAEATGKRGTRRRTVDGVRLEYVDEHVGVDGSNQTGSRNSPTTSSVDRPLPSVP